MRQYLDQLKDIQQNGVYKLDRTGTGCYSIFGTMMRFNMADGFPLVTTKKVHFKSVVHELIWLISGDTNTKYLVDNGVKIWNEWANEKGELGPVYGEQWRNWNGDNIDQLKNSIEELKTNPNSRRIVISAWNPSVLPVNGVAPKDQPELGKAALASCHSFFQLQTQEMTLDQRMFALRDMPKELVADHESDSMTNLLDKIGVPKHYLNLCMYMRSVDVGLGEPFNIASYALLLHMIAKVCNMVPKDYVHMTGDTHIYFNHQDQLKEQIEREPMPLPTIRFAKDKYNSIDDFKFEDVILENYQPHPAIKMEVSI